MTESAEFMAETFGVKVDTNGNYAVIDSLAGLSEDQRKEYGNLPLEAKYQYKHNVLESIYTKDYFNAAKSNDAKEQAIFDEMSMQVKVLSPGYLNMLSDDERTQLINDYLSGNVLDNIIVQKRSKSADNNIKNSQSTKKNKANKTFKPKDNFPNPINKTYLIYLY